MRIAYLDPHPVPGTAPESLQILYTTDALGQIGVDVTLVTPPADVRPEDILGRGLSRNVRIHHLPRTLGGWRSNKPFYRAAARRLSELRVDAVLVRNLKMAEHLLATMPGVPLFFETHELFAQTYREEHPHRNLRERWKLRALEQRERKVYSQARGLIALTPFLLEDIGREYGVATPGAVAPDGVDLDQARAVPAASPNPAPVLLYLGSLHPWKGIETIIRAIPHLTASAQLQIAGGNAQRARELAALTRELGVENAVSFLGPIEPGRRFELINAADICLLPLTESSIGSRYTSPLKLFEYLAAGKPVVASDLPTIRNVLEPGVDALLARSGDPESFAQQIDVLLGNEELRKQIGARAAVRAVAFSWTERARTIERLMRASLTGDARDVAFAGDSSAA